MNPALNAYLIDSIVRDHLEQAECQRRSRVQWAEMTLDPYDSVTVRRARPGDGEALERLGELDGRRLPAGPALLAEVRGRLLAARSIESGRSIADPFNPTAHLVELLELRSAHLRGADQPSPRRGRRARSLLRAFTAQARS